jgi:hypothetical protein
VKAGELKADRAANLAGRPRSGRSGPLTPEWRLLKGSSRCGRGKGRYERPAPSRKADGRTGTRRSRIHCAEVLIGRVNPISWRKAPTKFGPKRRRSKGGLSSRSWNTWNADPQPNTRKRNGGGEREEIGRIRKVSRKAAESVERFDPEGCKSPGGEWRQRKQLSGPARSAATGPKRRSCLQLGHQAVWKMLNSLCDDKFTCSYDAGLKKARHGPHPSLCDSEWKRTCSQYAND